MSDAETPCPCGGMPGTACGDLIITLREEIVRLKAALAAEEQRHAD